jgi:molybdopterin-binding protein
VRRRIILVAARGRLTPGTGERMYAAMQLSARNQLKGKVTKVNTAQVMAEVTVAVGDQEVVSVITRGSVERLGLKAGDDVTVIIKATEIMLGK